MAKPKMGIYGLTGCAGDQLAILNCEDELLDIVSSVELKSFIMAQTGNEECELDIAFVDGTVTQERDLKELREIRERSGLLIAMGTCAVWGGVAGMRNYTPRKTLKEKIYGEKADFLNPLPVKPLSAYVQVDFNLTGCPIEKEEFLKSIASLLHGDLPVLSKFALCTECKMNEYECVLNTRGKLCLGPVTVAGCGARCPGMNIACIGCRGLVDEANVASEVNLFQEKGFSLLDIKNRLHTFVPPGQR
ncbi:NADH:ubiquinone oxidoreductase [bacterium]|nr:NADH:ubiquinone oxidoreductase [bacterium]